MRNQRRGVLVCTLLVMGSCLLWGQATTSLHGTIYDTNGAVLPGASVTITDPQTGFTRTVQSESDGTYQFLQLHPTVYVVEVGATGFAKLKREDVRLQVNTPATMVLVTSFTDRAGSLQMNGSTTIQPLQLHAHLYSEILLEVESVAQSLRIECSSSTVMMDVMTRRVSPFQLLCRWPAWGRAPSTTDTAWMQIAPAPQTRVWTAHK